MLALSCRQSDPERPFCSLPLSCTVCSHSQPPFDAAGVLSPPDDLAFTIPLNGPFITPLCQSECLVHSETLWRTNMQETVGRERSMKCQILQVETEEMGFNGEIIKNDEIS